MELSHLHDDELCRRIASGDSLAEEQLLERHRRLVRICARPLFLVGGDSEDLIQEGMLGLLTAARSFREGQGATFHTYAEVCIKNRLRNVVRAATRGKHTPLNDAISFETPLFDRDNGVPADHTANPEHQLIGREEWTEKLERLKGRMSGFESEVLTRYLEGYTCNEIAVQLKKPQKSVDNAVQRIRKKVGAE